MLCKKWYVIGVKTFKPQPQNISLVPPLGLLFKISDEEPCLFLYGSRPPPPRGGNYHADNTKSLEKS